MDGKHRGGGKRPFDAGSVAEVIIELEVGCMGTVSSVWAEVTEGRFYLQRLDVSGQFREV